MPSRAIIIVDPKELRAAGYASLLTPWASRSEADLHVVQSVDEIENVSDYESLACIFCVGGASLHDPVVARTLDRLRGIFAQHPLIVLSDMLETEEIAAAVQAELRGFLPTNMPPHVALAAMQFVLAGGTYLPHSLEAPRRQVPASAYSLSPRPLFPAKLSKMSRDMAVAEIPSCSAAAEENLRQRHVEVLSGLCCGQTNKVIARQLDLTEATVKLYVRQLMKIFHAENRTQLALKASGHPQVESLTRGTMVAPALTADAHPAIAGAGDRNFENTSGVLR